MAQNGVFVFEADTAAFANRKRAARACLSCQKRKKRCPHTFTKSSDQLADKDGAEKVIPNLTHKEPIRFVGDTNPESILTDLSSRSKGAARYSRVGTWVESSRLQQETIRRELEAAAHAAGNSDTGLSDMALRQAAIERYAKVERGRRTLTGHQKNYLQAVGAFRVLPKATQDALITTYIACIDPLLPIIDCKKFLQDYTSGEVSVFLIQAICLVACKTEEAEQYLRLYEDGPLLDPIPFARSLHTGLDAAMKADLEADRFTKVQIMTLMSLHNDGPGGIEESSMHLVQAIHDAQTTGLHIKTPGRTQNDQGAMLWWTLWTLDKFNACLGGRPLMIADRDIDIGRPSLESNSRSQNMGVWLALGDLLDKVIEFYRPIADPDAAGWEKPFPSFTSITSHCDLELLQGSHRSLLEICYNIIGILSCRAGGPTSASYKRRINSADRIQHLMAQGRQTHLPPLPLVPYAASLSLTVAYRGLRDHHSDPALVQSNLTTRCHVLESLSVGWWTADAMAKLGRKALKSLQQPHENISRGRECMKNPAGLSAISDALEAEVAPCKYGPFEQRNGDLQEFKDKRRIGIGTEGMPAAYPIPATGTRIDDIENALQVLSDVAATHGQGPKQANGRHAERSAPFSTPMPHSQLHRSNSQPPGQTSTQPHRHSLPKTLAGNEATNPDYPFTNITNPSSNPFPMISTPSLDTVGTSPTQTPDTTHNNSNTIVPTSTSNPNGNNDPFNPFDYNPTFFNDLDNLFDGFFDLSMPTMFLDPLFEGAAFDFGPVGTMDFGYDMSTGMNMMTNGGGAGNMMSGSNIPMTMAMQMPMATMNVNNTINTSIATGTGVGTGYLDTTTTPISNSTTNNATNSNTAAQTLTPASVINSMTTPADGDGNTDDAKMTDVEDTAQTRAKGAEILSPTPSPNK